MTVENVNASDDVVGDGDVKMYIHKKPTCNGRCATQTTLIFFADIIFFLFIKINHNCVLEKGWLSHDIILNSSVMPSSYRLLPIDQHILTISYISSTL